MEYGLLIAKEPLFWIFRVWKIRSFLSQKIGGNMIFTDYWNVRALNFSGGGKYSLSLRQRFNGKMIFTVTEKFLFWNFREWEIRSFFEAKSSWKDDISWLLKSSCFGLPKSSCFELFFDGKYLLGLFQLSMIFHDLRNTVFRAVFLLTLSPTIYFQPKITHIVRDKDLVLFNGDQDCDKVS